MRGRSVFRRTAQDGTDARVGRWYLRRGSRRGRMRGTPRYSECAACPGTRVPRRYRKVEVLTDEVGGVFDGLNKQEKQKVATRSAQRTRTPAAWRSEVSRTATRQVCGSGQPGTSSGARPATTPVFGRPPITLAAAAPPHCARYLARRAPSPRRYSNSGGSQGWGVRGWKGRRGGAGLLPECAPGDVPGWPLRVALLLEKPMLSALCV